MNAIRVLAGLACILPVSVARAEVQDCFTIASLPATITMQGVHCLKSDLATSMTSGNAITINAPNVIIEMNGFKLGGLAAGAGTQARGIYALDRQNITIRNGTIRGFMYNIFLDATADAAASSGHLVEDMRLESARFAGVGIGGMNSVVRNNIVIGTGNGTVAHTAYGIFVARGRGHSIRGNIVAGVSETFRAYGIAVLQSGGVVIRGNEVHDVAAADVANGGSGRGIYAEDSTRTVVRDNEVVNQIASVSYGIVLDGPDDICRDNVVAGHSNPVAQCSVETGNTWP